MADRLEAAGPSKGGKAAALVLRAFADEIELPGNPRQLPVTTASAGTSTAPATAAENPGYLSTGISQRVNREEARSRGYTGDSCQECGSMSMVRNGTCLKCDVCGATTGCS